MLTKPELIEVLKAGGIEQAKKEMTRYGKILDVVDTANAEGEHRLYIIEYIDHEFSIFMTNGKVTKITTPGVLF